MALACVALLHPAESDGTWPLAVDPGGSLMGNREPGWYRRPVRMEHQAMAKLLKRINPTVLLRFLGP